MDSEQVTLRSSPPHTVVIMARSHLTMGSSESVWSITLQGMCSASSVFLSNTLTQTCISFHSPIRVAMMAEQRCVSQDGWTGGVKKPPFKRKRCVCVYCRSQYLSACLGSTFSVSALKKGKFWLSSQFFCPLMCLRGIR